MWALRRASHHLKVQGCILGRSCHAKSVYAVTYSDDRDTVYEDSQVIYHKNLFSKRLYHTRYVSFDSLMGVRSLSSQAGAERSEPEDDLRKHKMFGRALQGISSSSKLLANEATPVSSPLMPMLPSDGRKSDTQKAVIKPAKVQAVLKGIKQSPKKVNLVAELVRGMRVEDALLQLQVTVKRASQTVYQVIHSARANATHNHGLDADRLLVAEAFVGKGFFQKRISYHAKGRCGIKVRPECRLTVVVRETTPKEEAEIAKLKVHNFKKLSKREKRLVPHKLIETTPIWNRKAKSNKGTSNATGA